MQQILRTVGEHVVLFVERLGFFLCGTLVRSHALFDALLLGLCIVGGNQPFLVFFLQLGGFGLQVLLFLGPAFLCFLGLFLQGCALVQEKVALCQHGFNLHISDIA